MLTIDRHLRDLAVFLLLFGLLATGCTRPYWRENADAEVYGLIREKARLDGRWTPPRSDIIPLPQSRIYDPLDPDFGPLPPDDPAAHLYMERMSDCQRIHGDDYYNKIGSTEFIENPTWVSSLPGVGPAGFCPPGPTLAQSDRPSRGLTGSLFGRTKSATRAEPSGKAVVQLSPPPTPNARRSNAIQQVAYEEPAVDEAAAGPDPFEPGRLPEGKASPEDRKAIPPLPADVRTPIVPPPELSETTPELPDRTGALRDPAPPARLGGSDLSAGNPALPVVEDLTLRDAVALSYLHGRDYQFALENVYLAALDLAFDRFQFDIRFLGLTGPPRVDSEFESVPGVRDQLVTNSRFGFRRLLPAGGQWAIELANTTLWMFSDSPDESSTFSNLSYSFVQPLLLGFGRKVVLEGLTQSERNLLYSIRELARFRQEFFVQIVSAGPSGGFLGLLQQTQTVANLEDNIRRLEEQLEIVRVSQADALTQAQLQSRLLQTTQQLRESRRRLQDQLDQFNIQLGLPPDLRITPDRKLLLPFQLIDPAIYALEESLTDDFLTIFRQIDDSDPSVESLRTLAELLSLLASRIEDEAFAVLLEDFEKVQAGSERRFATLPDPALRPEIEEALLRDGEAFARAQRDFTVAREEVDRLAADAVAANTLEERRNVYGRSKQVQEDLLRIAQGLQTIEVGLRAELIELNPFEMPEEVAVGYALTNRVDLMNQRAFVVDARRKVEVSANDLRAVLNVRVEGNVRTRPLFQNDNPFDFRGRFSSYRAGVEFVPPLDRIAQRNQYRVTQILYQRERRSYMEVEDRIKFQVRTSWRGLQVLRQNFETARLAIRVAAIQYDQAIETANAPAGASGTSSRGGSSTGLNLIQALNSVLSAQNSLIGIFVDYETARLNIYRDMGLMQIDGDGMWVDRFYQDGQAGSTPLPDDVEPPAIGPLDRNGPSLLPADPVVPPEISASFEQNTDQLEGSGVESVDSDKSTGPQPQPAGLNTSGSEPISRNDPRDRDLTNQNIRQISSQVPTSAKKPTHSPASNNPPPNIAGNVNIIPPSTLAPYTAAPNSRSHFTAEPLPPAPPVRPALSTENAPSTAKKWRPVGRGQ